MDSVIIPKIPEFRGTDFNNSHIGLIDTACQCSFIMKHVSPHNNTSALIYFNI